MSSPLFQVDLNIQKTQEGLIECNNFNRTCIMNSTSIGLSCYEIICAPRKILNEKELSFSSNQIERVVKEILHCAICYEIYFDPVNIKTCLHKFCKKCIEDYNRKIKKECAICRHAIETRRLMKEDLKIKQIIGCMIPDIEKFKQEEEREITLSIPNCIFKDEEKYRHQNEKAYKIEEISIHEPKSSAIRNTLPSRQELIEEEGNNSHESKALKIIDKGEGAQTLLTKKKLRMHNLKQGLQGNEIEVKIDVEEGADSLKRFFLKTKLSLYDSFTLEFISKFICYKQNFPHDYLEKIRFYTLEHDNAKTFWEQNDSLKKVKDSSSNNPINKLTLYFLLEVTPQ